eukprot:5692851-Pleurochrysis_carterae.AAC.1
MSGAAAALAAATARTGLALAARGRVAAGESYIRHHHPRTRGLSPRNGFTLKSSERAGRSARRYARPRARPRAHPRAHPHAFRGSCPRRRYLLARGRYVASRTYATTQAAAARSRRARLAVPTSTWARSDQRSDRRCAPERPTIDAAANNNCHDLVRRQWGDLRRVFFA